MQRLNPFDTVPEAMKALVVFSGSHGRTVEPELIELTKARVLQILGGRYGDQQCKAIAGRTAGLAAKIACLSDWYTSRAFSSRERAALLWVEDVVYAPSHGVSDISYAGVKGEYSPDELWELTVTIVSTCAWVQIAKVFQLTEAIL